MLLLVIFGIVGLVLGGLFLKSQDFDGSGWFGGILIAALVTAILGGIPTAVIGQTVMADCVSPVNTSLVNISDGSGVAGSFFLGSGYIGQDLYYYYYYQLPDGGFQGAAIKASLAEIKYGKPHMVTYTPAYTNNWKYFAHPLDQVCTTIFYVPQGSIKQNFTLGTK